MPATTRRSNRERREQSTELVLEAALRRFVERGYRATSIDDIARDAGLTKGAVYFYFKGKAALLLELLDQSQRLYTDIFERMDQSGVGAGAQLEMFVEWAARVGVKNKELLLLPILMSLEFNGQDESVEQALNHFYDRYTRRWRGWSCSASRRENSTRTSPPGRRLRCWWPSPTACCWSGSGAANDSMASALRRVPKPLLPAVCANDLTTCHRLGQPDPAIAPFNKPAKGCRG